MKLNRKIFVLVILLSALLSQAGCNRGDSVKASHERLLRNDLTVLRTAIDQYTLDKRKAPQSLEDVISAGYMKVLPEEPTTRRTDCWVPVQEDSTTAIDQNQPGIIDVHSCNDQLSSDGSAYSSW